MPKLSTVRITLTDLGNPLPEGEYTEVIQNDLAAFVADMAVQNGVTTGGYLNNVLEKGVRADMTEFGYTPVSIDKFMATLRAEKRCDWECLKQKDDPK